MCIYIYHNIYIYIYIHTRPLTLQLAKAKGEAHNEPQDAGNAHGDLEDLDSPKASARFPESNC